MTYVQRRSGGRPAFTLIELLVVIAIIAILVSLTSAAVVRVLIKGPELKTIAELNELQTKLSDAQNKAQAPYLPSMLHLSKLNNYPNRGVAGSVDSLSIAVLTQMFKRHACYDFKTPPAGQFIDWNGDGNPNEEIYLEGQQALVFYLGGVPQYDSTKTIVTMTGFLNNEQNPAQNPAPANIARTRPDFEFQSNRLKLVTTNGPIGAGITLGAFPQYVDGWGTQPYVFFASYNPEGLGLYQGTDSSLAKPWSDPTGKWVNASSFQILSAGRDGKFGAGGVWNPASGTTDPNGRDDQANFSPHLLGNGGN